MAINPTSNITVGDYGTYYRYLYASRYSVNQTSMRPMRYVRSVDGAGVEAFAQNNNAGNLSGDIFYYAYGGEYDGSNVFSDTSKFPYTEGRIGSSTYVGAASAHLPNGLMTATAKDGYGFVGWWVWHGNEEWYRLEDFPSSISLTVGDAPNKLRETNLGVQNHVWSYRSVRAVFGARFIVKAYRCVAGGTASDPAYDVAYFTDGGGGDYRDIQVINGVAENMPSVSSYMRCSGFVFVEWNTKRDGTGVSVADGGDISGLSSTPNGEVELFAIWRRATVTTSVAFGEGVPQQQSAPTISVSPAPTDGVYAEGTTITAVAQTTGLVGAEFGTWTATGIDIGSGDDANPTLSFQMPAHEVTLTANYVLGNVYVSVSLDAASSGAASQPPSVTDASDQALPTDEDERPYSPYGSMVVFHAASPASGYTFDGWYVGGEKRSSQQNWSVTLGDGLSGSDVSVVAKYAVEITVGKLENGGTGSFSVDGSEYASATSTSKSVALGDTLDLSAVATTGYFGGWYIDDSANPSTLPVTASVVISEAGSYVAHFIATAPEFTITCQSAKADGQAQDASAGTLVVAADSGITDNGNGTYTVEGFRDITLVATPGATNPLPLSRVGRLVGAELADVDISRPVAVSMDATYKAIWGVATSYTITATVAQQSAAMGAVGIGDDFAPSVSMSLEEGAKVVFAAVPYGGYKFDGWYMGDVMVSASTRFAYTVSMSITLFARFSADSQAIFAWEGSSANKTVEWASKVYVTQKPFDPVAARVDAAGYPVDLTVRTYSSPDKVDPLPVRDHELTAQRPMAVLSQDGRRLQRMRPERYVQVTVKASHEIDAVVVGTNMTEVN